MNAPTKRAPDFTGIGNWRAWRGRLQPVGQRGRPDWDATLEAWLLFCQGAHACWSYWWLTLIHLRPIPGVKPAYVQSPGNGWELLCGAHDPASEPDPDSPEATVRLLTPLDWVVQFGSVKTDHDASRVAVACIRAIMSGRVSPDSDFRQYWRRAVPDTAQCFAQGGHPQS